MSVLEKLGSAAGTVVGTLFGGPVGTIVGGKVGGFIGEAIDEQVAPPAPRHVAPPPKPAIKSKTIWLNLVVSLGVALLGWAASFQWDQVVSPTLAVVIVGVANMALRFVSSGAIGRPEE
jgi:hypothetical protein